MKIRNVLSILSLTLIVVLICSFYIPQLRVRCFAYIYHEEIESGIASNEGVPASDAVIGGYKYVNTWNEEPWMTEFVLLQYDENYYGCYYSPEDVPFSFQNITDSLTKDGENRWKWRENESEGYTSKLFDNWFYFKAKL